MKSCFFSAGHSSSNGVHSSGKESAPREVNSFLEEVTGLGREAKKGKREEMLPLKIYPFALTHCIQVDSSGVICWTGSFVILRVSGLFDHFYSII